MVSKLAGRLKCFSSKWKELTTNSHILSHISGYKIPFDSKPFQIKVYNQTFSIEENKLIIVALDELLCKNVIKICQPCSEQFISKIFLRDKPNGKKRLILNLKQLNSFITAPHFKMEDYRTALRLIQENMFFATIDIKDAYYTLPIEKSYRKYLRFYHNQVLYEFTCLPFGLSTAPYCFTKIMKPIITFMRENGILCVNYLDDFLILGHSKEECRNSVCFTTSLLESLGFIINYEKSCILPSVKQKFLGFIFDSIKMSIQITEDKKQKTLHMLNIIKNRKNFN